MAVAPFVEVDIGDGGFANDDLARIVKTIAEDGGLAMPGWRASLAESVDPDATVWTSGATLYVSAHLFVEGRFPRAARAIAYALAVLAGWDVDQCRALALQWESDAAFQGVIADGKRR